MSLSASAYAKCDRAAAKSISLSDAKGAV